MSHTCRVTPVESHQVAELALMRSRRRASAAHRARSGPHCGRASGPSSRAPARRVAAARTAETRLGRSLGCLIGNRPAPSCQLIRYSRVRPGTHSPKELPVSTPAIRSPPPAPGPKRGLPTWGIVAIVVGGLVALCCIGGIVLVALNGDAAREGFEDGIRSETASPTPEPEEPTITPSAPTTPAEPSLTAAEVPVLTIPDDLEGMNAAIAEDRLRSAGFTRVDFASADPNDTVVILPQNWTVTEVDPEPGTDHPADGLIVLTCTKQ
jgi:hypothetical protein